MLTSRDLLLISSKPSKDGLSSLMMVDSSYDGSDDDDDAQVVVLEGERGY